MGDNISTVGDNISTVDGYLQYCGGITAVDVGIASVLWGYLQYCGGCSVQWADSISTVER